MESRKLKEIEFHNKLRNSALKEDTAQYYYLTSNKKYYSIADSSMSYYKNWLMGQCEGKRILDYGCGDGTYSCFLARHGADVVGIDISDVSVKNCEARVREEGLAERAHFQVMDCEALQFENDTFDLVCEAGVLHHLDFQRAIAELARVVKPNGQVICYEALGHNIFFQMYRRLTPHLRTKYETDHILKMKDLEVAKKYFGTVNVRFFHLAVLAAVPFRKTSFFSGLVRVLEKLDSYLSTIPIIRSQAWMMIFVLSQPKKTLHT